MKSKFFSTAAMALALQACGFLSDNAERSLVHKSDTPNVERSGCPDSEHFQTDTDVALFLKCQRATINKLFDSLHPDKPEELHPKELQALLNQFVFKDHPLNDAEISGLYAARKFLSSRNAATYSRSDLLDVIDWADERHTHIRQALYKDVPYESLGDYTGPAFRAEIDARDARHDAREILILEFLGRNKNPGILTESDFLGLTTLTLRVFAQLSFRPSENADAIRGAYRLLALFLGFVKPETTEEASIPLSFFHHAPELLSALGTLYKDLRLPIHDGTTYSIHATNSEGLTSYQAQKKIATQSLENFLKVLHASTGYQNPENGFTIRDLSDALKKFTHISLVNTHGEKRHIEINPADLAQKILSFKAHLVGHGDQTFAQSSLDDTVRWIVRWVFDSEVGSHVNFTVAKPEAPALLKYVFWDPSTLSIVERNWEKVRYLHPRRRWGNDETAPLAAGAIKDHYTLWMISAFLEALGAGGKPYLEYQTAQKTDDLRDAIRFLATLRTAVSTLIDDAKQKHIVSDVVDKSTESGDFTEMLLKNPTLLSALVFYADNWCPESNSDGALNAAEIANLLQLIDKIQKLQTDEKFSVKDLNDPKIEVPQVPNLKMDDLEPRVQRTIVANASRLNNFFTFNDLALPFYQQMSPLMKSYSFYPWLCILAGNLTRDRILGPDLLAFYDAHIKEWRRLQTALNTLLGIAKEPDFKRSAFFEILLSLNEQIDFEARDSTTVRFENVESYMKSRLKSTSFTWLSKKLQILMTVVPENFTQMSLASLIWNSETIASLAQGVIAEGKPVTPDQLLGWLMSLETPQANQEIPRSEFTIRILHTADLLTHLQMAP